MMMMIVIRESDNNELLENMNKSTGMRWTDV